MSDTEHDKLAERRTERRRAVSAQNLDREKLLSTLHDELADMETGPLSDTPYIAAEVDADGMLSLFEGYPSTSFPDVSVDVPQLTDAILASDWLREHDGQVRREAAAEQREKDAQIVEQSARPRPGHGSMSEGSRSAWYAYGRRDGAAAIREQGNE